jgi:hypothetical protein
VNPEVRRRAQWTWDAYGNVFSADHIAPHPFMSVGHKGLFVERLDVGVADASVSGSQLAETPRLVPFAQLVYHNRNRSYNPQLGRFLQADPNASGTRLHDRAMFGGQSPFAYGPTLDLTERFADGANLYQYVRSSPWILSDPLGLTTGEDAFNNATELMGLLDPLPGPGDFIRSVLKELVSEYSANQEWDAEWASDWSTGDDWHSRGDSLWVTLAIGRGLYSAFDIDLPFTERSINPIDWVADSKTPKKGSSVKTPAGKAKYSKTITVNGKRAYKYTNPKGGHELIKFDRDAILESTRVKPGTRASEKAEAMKNLNLTETPKGYVWHHHWVEGVMQLVPEKLHRASGASHIGRRQFWPNIRD